MSIDTGFGGADTGWMPSVPDPSTQASASGGSTLGASTLMSSETCGAAFGLRFIYQLVPASEPPDRLRGALVHAGVAYHYASRMPVDQQPYWFKAKPLEQELRELGRGEPGVIDEARNATNAFIRWASAISDPWIPVAVERTFSATVKELDPQGSGPEDDILVEAKLDLVPAVVTGGSLRPTASTLIVDHKSTISGTKEGRLYAWSTSGGRYRTSLASVLYFKIGQIDIPRKLGLPAPDAFYIQRILSRPPFDVDRNPLALSAVVIDEDVGPATRRHVRNTVELLAQYKAGRPLVRSFVGCFGCDYVEICHASSASDRDRVLTSKFVVKSQEPRTELPRRLPLV